MSKVKYPNLELIAYKAKEALTRDAQIVSNFLALKEQNKHICIEFEAHVFLQIWGSTCTGFDVMKDGSPAWGGAAMTKEYTTVMREINMDVYIVFFGEKECYLVDDVNERFLEDLSKHNMASLSEAKRIY